MNLNLLARRAKDIAAYHASTLPELETVPQVREALAVARGAIQQRADDYPTSGDRPLCPACWMAGKVVPIDSGDQCDACDSARAA